MDLQALHWDDALELLILAMAAVIFVVALQAYRRTRTTRLLFFAAAFGAYALKGVFVALEVLLYRDNVVLNALEIVAEASVLVLLLLAILRT